MGAHLAEMKFIASQYRSGAKESRATLCSDIGICCISATALGARMSLATFSFSLMKPEIIPTNTEYALWYYKIFFDGV